MSWSMVLKVIPPLFRLGRGRIRVKDLRSAVDRFIREVDAAAEDGEIAGHEWLQIGARSLEVLVYGVRGVR